MTYPSTATDTRAANAATTPDNLFPSTNWTFRRDAWPLALAALVHLDTLAEKMPAYREHAIAVAAAINADGAARAHPDPPQTPMFHVHLPAGRHAVERAGQEILAEHGIQLWGRVRSASEPGRSAFEVSVGENAMEFTPDEVVGLIHDVLARAR
ncbi:hypothetical protein AB0J43_53805, partial [Nonomuraea fuscirosea]